MTAADNDLTALFPQLAKALLGEPSPALSSEHECVMARGFALGRSAKGAGSTTEAERRRRCA